jgi:hypothetical protein
LATVIPLNEIFVGVWALAIVRDVTKATDLILGTVADHGTYKASVLAHGTCAPVIFVKFSHINCHCVVSFEGAPTSSFANAFGVKLWAKN